MNKLPAAGLSDAKARSTWRLIAGAVCLALLCCLLPQEVPLEWYPLNHPGTDTLLLELTCAANQRGEVQIFYNTGKGINELESIRFLLPSSTANYTYAFPLPDAPIIELRLDPIANGGTLSIRQMRVVNRRGDEIRRFTRESFIAQNQIAQISPAPGGWNITSMSPSNDPFVRIELPYPILARGAKARNVTRCLLSTSYLALMLWIFSMAVLFAFYRPKAWPELITRLCLLALFAIMSSAICNRGLIRNSFAYARYQPPAKAPGWFLEIDLRTSAPDTAAQLFWDIGSGILERDSARCQYLRHEDLQTLSFPLPHRQIKALRFDPQDGEATVRISGIRIVDSGRQTKAIVPLDSLEVVQEITTLTLDRDILTVDASYGSKDPILRFSASAVSLIDRVVTSNQLSP